LGKSGKDWRNFLKRTRLIKRKIAKLNKKFDLVLQIGAMFGPVTSEKPYITYNDQNMKMAWEMWPEWTPFASNKEFQRFFELERALHQGATRVLTYSNFTRDSFIKDYGIEPEKVITVGSALKFKEPSDINKKYDGKTVLFVSTDFKRKGGFILLEAFGMVLREIEDARLIIVGGLPEMEKQDYQNVEFVGTVTRDRMPDFYRRASIFVLPALYDAFPSVILEAMIYKLPCVATNVCGIPDEVEDRKTGFIVAPGSPKELSEKIILLLKDEALMEKMGKEGHKKVLENFTSERVAEKIGKVFKECL